MAGIKDLFTYKKDVVVRNRAGKEGTVWVKLLGDSDLNKAYRAARIVSQAYREALRDESTEEYMDQVLPIVKQSREELITMILDAQRNRVTQLAYVNVNREELIKIEDVAEEPDAPTLEEQEILDKKLDEQNKEFEKRIDEYIEDNMTRLKTETEALSDAELVEKAKEEMINILPLQVFYSEINAQKAFRGTYTDKNCTARVFTNVEEFHDFDTQGKSALIGAYLDLEINGNDIKN